MTAVASPAIIPQNLSQHLMLEGISWRFYETILSELEERPALQVTFDTGSIEIMSPLSEHDIVGRLLGQFLFVLCMERDIPMMPFGSTTFRDELKQKGLEPDECFYIQNIEAAKKVGRTFDPSIDPPPDLAIEVDVTHRSIAREPIYAALGVPELWRIRSSGIQCRHLTASDVYEDAERSLAFSFLKPADLWRWTQRARSEGPVAAVPDFKVWAKQLN